MPVSSAAVPRRPAPGETSPDDYLTSPYAQLLSDDDGEGSIDWLLDGPVSISATSGTRR